MAVTLATLLALASACASKPPAPSQTPSPAARAAVSNARLGYSWTLPDDWEVVPPETLWSIALVANQDLHAAKKKGQRRPALWIHVTDLMQIVPGAAKRDVEKDFEGAKFDAERLLERVGGHVLEARRVSMLGHDGFEVMGAMDADAVNLRTVYVGYRKFDFRCLGGSPGGAWECGEALRDFRIEGVPDPVSAQEVPRVLHLREPKLGFAFDAPDDSWAAFGPRTAGSGLQTVWIWRKDQRGIDVGVMRVAKALSETQTEQFIAGIASSSRHEGHSVTERVSTLAGKRCYHLETAKADGWKEDMLFLVQGRSIYAVLISQWTRDPHFVEAAKKGFRLISE